MPKTTQKLGMNTEHITEAELEAFVTDRRPLSASRRLALAEHLSTDCDACWRHVDGLEPREPEMSTDPLIRAMLRVSAGNERCGLALPSRYFGSLRRGSPFQRFAFFRRSRMVSRAVFPWQPRRIGFTTITPSGPPGGRTFHMCPRVRSLSNGPRPER